MKAPKAVSGKLSNTSEQKHLKMNNFLHLQEKIFIFLDGSQWWTEIKQKSLT